MSKTMGFAVHRQKNTDMQTVKPFWFTFLLFKMIFVGKAVLTSIVRWERVVIDKLDSFTYNI